LLPNTSRQLILVVAENWLSTTGSLQRFERAEHAAAWLPVGQSIAVSLGRSGLAWGLGLHGEVGAGEPHKREGDDCAPAGIFAVSELFGYASAASAFAKALKMPYRGATADLKCIDDPASRYYNQMVEAASVPMIDWHSHEEMLRTDARYELGAVIAHNQRPVVVGAGSCIFMHIWQAAGVPTAGCTAMALHDMAAICHWLDVAQAPTLVQLPASMYRRYKADWLLP
jgi:L,D-peptidoglycan transpeptidase YkuD (ErfK/YbiS/YcfS/YnhG family)